MRMLGLPPSLANARLSSHGTWVRAIIAVGPTRLHRVVERATALLGDAKPVAPDAAAPVAPPKPAATPRGDAPS